MKLDEIIESRFHFLFADGLFRITEIHIEADSKVFAIVRGRYIVLRFSVEDGRELLTVAQVGFPRWYDIRDAFCMVDETYIPTDNEDFRSLATMLRGNLDRVEGAFRIGVWHNTLDQLEHCMSHNVLVRAAVVSLVTASKLNSYDELEQFVRIEFDFLLQNDRYIIVKPDDDIAYLELKGDRMQFSFANDRGCELLHGGPLSPSYWFGLWMIRGLYEKNFDAYSLLTFIQWKEVLHKEIGQMESLFDKQNVSNTFRVLKKIEDDFQKEVFRSDP